MKCCSRRVRVCVGVGGVVLCRCVCVCVCVCVCDLWIFLHEGSSRRVGTLSRLASNSGATARRLSRSGSPDSVSIHVICCLTPPLPPPGTIFKQRFRPARGYAQPPCVERRGDGAAPLSLHWRVPPAARRGHVPHQCGVGSAARTAGAGDNNCIYICICIYIYIYSG